jgi:hypothetical protein
MFYKIVSWLKEAFNDMEDACLYTVDFVNGENESF